jgi:hypothetical protein
VTEDEDVSPFLHPPRFAEWQRNPPADAEQLSAANLFWNQGVGRSDPPNPTWRADAVTTFWVGLAIGCVGTLLGIVITFMLIR